MSKFIDAVRVEMTGRQFAPGIYPGLRVFMGAIPDSISKVYPLKEYDILVRWQMRGKCKPSQLGNMQDSFVRELREAVYGDLKGMIIRLERAVYEQDEEKLLMETRGIIKEIFG